MNTKKRLTTLHFLVLILSAACVFNTAYSQQVLSDNDISLPANAKEGTLKNGLHYIILPNANPSNTTEFRLVMKLGSTQESESQLGSAHFLEHMAFAGTKHFPGRSMIEYLEGLGMKFGRDINAVTGYDRTIFMLTVPMNEKDQNTADSTLLILKDWLTNISFEEERTRKERGVILEELRGYDIGDDFYSLKIGQNRFTKRMPLGSTDDIKSIDRSKLIEFYQKWYTPQLASVIVTGCVNQEKIEKQIRKLFGNINTKNIKDYQSYPLTYNQGVHFKEIKSNLKKNSELEIIIPHPCVVGKDLASTYKKELGNLLVRMINKRFDLRNIPVSVSDDWYLADKNHFVISVSRKNKQEILDAITRISGELNYIASEGFCPNEMQSAISDFQNTLKVTSDGQTSAQWCEDFTDYILSGDKYIHNEKEMTRLKDMFNHTDSKELQELLSDWMEYQKQSLLIAYRNCNIQTDSVNHDEITKAWENGKNLKIDTFVYHQPIEEETHIETPECLKEIHNPKDYMIKDKVYYPETNIHEYSLDNGLKFILRPTKDENETLILTAFARGGTFDLPENEYHLLEGTAGYIEMGGIQSVNYDTLTTYMGQESISLNVSIGNYWHDIIGMSPVKRSQELFNLIYEKIYNPELCYQDFEDIRKEELENIGKETLLEQMMKQAQDRLLNQRLDSLVGNAPSTIIRERTHQDIQRLDLNHIADYYRTLFGNPKGLTFVITGNFNTEVLIKQLTGTFGRMKSPENPVNYTNKPVRLPQKSYVEEFANDIETQTQLEYVFAHNYKPSLKEGLTLKLMRDALQQRLLKVLREEKNIVYSPYVSLFYKGIPEQTFYIDISASVEVSNTSIAEEAILNIIKELQKKPIDNEELEMMKRSFIVTKNQVLDENATTDWRNTIVGLLKNGESLKDFDDYSKNLEQITAKDLQESFKKYLDTNKFILLYMGKHLKHPTN